MEREVVGSPVPRRSVLLGAGTVAPWQQRTYTWRTHAPYRRRDGSWDGGSAGYWH
ncbi:hypothetical protein ACGFNU_30340 [Spirillospora sp. NPDC048911]|uniref:hypothetical protein n=1 Tax=Spirillospora sp. NPDC048911 TaxID=3364527 RepID=UPI0037230F1C